MIILDTNVLSEVMKPAPDAVVAAWMTRQPAADLFTTSVSEAELLYGVAILPDGRRKAELAAKVRSIVSLFDDRVLNFDRTAARDYALIVVERQRIGRPIQAFDAQIAAIARSQGMQIATRNVKDFVHVGLRVIDPWSGPGNAP
jgi:toxin FitB